MRLKGNDPWGVDTVKSSGDITAQFNSDNIYDSTFEKPWQAPDFGVGSLRTAPNALFAIFGWNLDEFASMVQDMTCPLCKRIQKYILQCSHDSKRWPHVVRWGVKNITHLRTQFLKIFLVDALCFTTEHPFGVGMCMNVHRLLGRGQWQLSNLFKTVARLCYTVWLHCSVTALIHLLNTS